MPRPKGSKNKTTIQREARKAPVKAQNGLSVKVRYREPKTPKLAFVGGTERSNWVDMYTAESYELLKGQYQEIRLGVAMKLPDGYEGNLCLRSSTPKKWKVFMPAGRGVIDSSYCGNDDEWLLPVIALDNTFIPKGTRIAQFRIEKRQPEIRFVEVDDLGESNRGGLGSTGEK